MDFPKDLLYTKDHEWTRKGSDDTVTVGLTDHAQEALGEIVYVELPQIGRELKTHETFGVVESIKAVSDCYSPVTGKVVEVNQAVANEPALVNRSAHSDGWLVRIKLTDKNSLGGLMNADDYKKYVESLK